MMSTSFRLVRPAALVALLLAGASALSAADAAADTWCGQQVSPLLRPALQGVQTLCSVQAPDGPLGEAAAKTCFASWSNVKNLSGGQQNLYALAAGWEALAATPAPYDPRLLRASAADATLILSQVR